jgi:hypothetical protein
MGRWGDKRHQDTETPRPGDGEIERHEIRWGDEEMRGGGDREKKMRE